MAKATQNAPRWVRRKEAAAELGFSRQRLEKLIKEGRVDETPQGLIDIEKAARQLEQTLDPVRRAVYEATAVVAPKPKPVASAQQRRRPYKVRRGAVTPPAAGEQGEFGLDSYAAARARKANTDAALAQAKLDQVLATTVPRAEVAAKEFAVARMVRDRIIGFPARLANYVPPEAMKMLSDECDRLIRELQDEVAKVAEDSPQGE